MMGGLHKKAMETLVEVQGMKGISEAKRAKMQAMAGDLGMRMKDWSLAKVCCERALSIPGADPEDRASCTETLKTLRKFHPELFK